MPKTAQKLTTFLWFDSQAEEAARSKRTMAAMLKMKKLDVDALKRAYEGR